MKRKPSNPLNPGDPVIQQPPESHLVYVPKNAAAPKGPGVWLRAILPASKPAPSMSAYEGPPIVPTAVSRSVRSDLDGVVADESHAEMTGTGTAARARLRERARCRAIITSPEAEGQRQFAIFLACNTRIARSEAIAFLASMPRDGLFPQRNGRADRASINAAWDRAHARDPSASGKKPTNRH